MNAWIVYDSKYGNNKNIAEALASHLKDKNSVHVHYAKDIKPEVIINDGVDLLLFGGPLRFGTPSRTMKQWVSRMVEMLDRKKIQIKQVALWGTHMKESPGNTPGKCSWDMAKQQWKAILETLPAEKKVPEIQGFPVVAVVGGDSLDAGWQDDVARFAKTIKEL